MFQKLNLQILDGRANRIAVPWATGIQEVDAHAVNYLYRISPPGSKDFIEFVLTPFRVTLWSDLWYVNLVNKEEIGIVARLSEFMRAREINIVAMYSNTTWGGRYHASRIALDCRDYKSEGDPSVRQSSARAELRRLKRELAASFIKEIVVLHGSEPSISIERDQSLWSLYKVSKHLLDNSEEHLPLVDGSVTIPSQHVDRFAENYSAAYEISRVELDKVQALTSLDPQSDVLRITIFFRGFGILPIIISADNEPGAIAAVTDALAQAGFNILASRALSVRERRMCLWLLLDSGSRPPDRPGDEAMTSRIQGIVDSSPRAREHRTIVH